MKKKIFVTGTSGSGKTTLSQTLNTLGYKAYNIKHNQFGLFKFIRKDTGEHYVDYDNTDIEKVKNASWICDVDKLKKLLSEQTEDISFYCGTASNKAEIMPLFDKVFFLKVSPDVLYKRLLVREGTDDYANTEAGRQMVLSKIDISNNKYIEAGAIPINADLSSLEVARNIVASSMG